MLNPATIQQIKNYIGKLQPRVIDKLFYYCLPYRKKIVYENLQRVFADQLSIAEKKKLAQCFYGHLGRSLLENIALRVQSEDSVKQQAVVVGEEYLYAADAGGKGALILTGHFGNWELAPVAGMLNFTRYQHRFHFVRKTLGSKRIEKILFRRFYAAGLNVIPKRNALSKVLQAVERNDGVVFVMDQHASINSRDGIAVDFFGKPAGTFRSLALIARNSGAPVIPATAYRREDGKHVLEFMAPLPWITHDNAEQEIYLNTLAYNQTLEKLVLAHPEQWLWLHRRWKQG